MAAMLTANLMGQVMGLPGIKYDKIQDFGLSTDGQFLAITDGGAAHVMHLDAQTSSLRPVFYYFIAHTHRLPSDHSGPLKGSFEFTLSFLMQLAIQKARHETLAIQLSEGKGSVSGYAFLFQMLDHSIVRHVAFDGSSTGETHENSRALLTTTTGSIQLWQHDKMRWKKVVTSHAVDEEGYFGRLQHQLSDAKNLPRCLTNLARRFAKSSYATVSASATSSSDEDTLTRGAFGFRQIIVAATSHGKLFGIDSSNG
ncbi:hypothetical protein M405DRAFT_914539 [Rhizopogon salebrosus TDB-379]|nr:hypothetical protein M405DRAFT_914539 [Rhizopogon salebrosus TDB-379]